MSPRGSSWLVQPYKSLWKRQAMREAKKMEKQAKKMEKKQAKKMEKKHAKKMEKKQADA